MATKIPPANALRFRDVFKGSQVTKILTASELLLAYSLNKYSLALLGRPFTVLDLAINPRILRSRHALYVMSRSYDLNFKPSDIKLTPEELKEETDKVLKTPFFTDDCSYTVPTAVSDTEVLYDMNQVTPQNRCLTHNRSHAYLDLLAYILIMNYKDGKQRRLIIDDSQYPAYEEFYTDLMVLRLYGNKLATPEVVTMRYPENPQIQLDILAYFAYQHQIGFMTKKEYAPTAKFRVARTLLNKGDLCVIYRKHPSIEYHAPNLHAPYMQCSIARVDDISNNGISVTVFPGMETRRTTYLNTRNHMMTTNQYTIEDAFRFVQARETLKWDKVAVGPCNAGEYAFILPIWEEGLNEDVVRQWLRIQDQDIAIDMHLYDAIYAVFEDWGVQYNKTAFLEKCFKGQLPLYERYRQQGILSSQQA